MRALKFCYENYNKTIPKVAAHDMTEMDADFLKAIEEKYEKYVELLNKV